MLKKTIDSINQAIYIETDTHSKLKVRLVGTKLQDEVAHKRIKKAIIQKAIMILVLVNVKCCIGIL